MNPLTISTLSAPAVYTRAAGPKVSPQPAQPADASRLEGFDLQEVLRTTRERALSLEPRLGDYVQGQLLVKLGPSVSAGDLKELLGDYGASVKREYRFPPAMAERFGGRLVQLELPAGLTTPQALAAMEQDGRVEFAVANNLVEVYGFEEDSATPQEETQLPPGAPDDLHAQQWNLYNAGQTEGTPDADISALEAWNVTTGRADGPLIAVIDSGIDFQNPELAPNMWINPGETADGQDNDGNGIVDDIHGMNAVDGSGNSRDDSGHGTHVASIIAARANNGEGMAGINWEGRLMSLKFLESSGRGSIADAIEALAYAEARGARITMNGWGSEVQNQALFEVMKASSALHICASGNDGYDNDTRPIHPASFPLDNIISVAATDHDDDYTRFSNLGANSVDLAAPGRKVHSLVLDNEYKLLGGTSTAAAHVAGVAGLIASQYPQATNDEIKTRLLAGVDPLPKRADRVASGGRLNAFKALEDDSSPPASPTDLWISRLDGQNVQLSWTATGDDDRLGQAHHYELRYATSPIVDGPPQGDQVRFEDASPIRTSVPGEPGAAESAGIKVSPSGKPQRLHFALRVVDNAGNRSPLATTEATLPPSLTAFEDSFDAPDTAWAAEGEWTRVKDAGRGMVWTDSPDTDYQNNLDVSVTSPEISLEGWRDARLHFDARYTIEPSHDKCAVEVYGRRWWGGTRWRTVAELDGFSDWKNQTVDLSAYDGQTIKVRFRMDTDDSRTAYGVQVDNVVVTGEKSQQEAPGGGCFGSWSGEAASP